MLPFVVATSLPRLRLLCHLLCHESTFVQGCCQDPGLDQPQSRTCTYVPMNMQTLHSTPLHHTLRRHPLFCLVFVQCSSTAPRFIEAVARSVTILNHQWTWPDPPCLSDLSDLSLLADRAFSRLYQLT